ncbi:hypothetical protein OAB11_03170 [Verrucomicrobia bacterium]|nr:hypothetical protein [Verrucomicrobiota bacterium]MDG1857058.1 hypothetical protein [Verrucomicrobiota bacterium]
MQKIREHLYLGSLPQSIEGSMMELIHSLENQEEEVGSDIPLFLDREEAKDDDYPEYSTPEIDAFRPLQEEKKHTKKERLTKCDFAVES